jgi:predicted permease
MPARKKLFRLPWRTARQIGADVDEEVRFHLDTRAEELVRRQGLSPDAARLQAIREFGDVDDARRYMITIDRVTEAATRRSEILSDILTDLRYAARKLRKSPAFTITTVLTLALGIGANTAIFSVVDSVLLRPMPWPDADRLVRIKQTDGGAGDAASPPDLADYRTGTKTFADFALIENAALNLTAPGESPERLNGGRVSASWFSLLGTPALRGRTFTAGEDQEGAPKVAVISERLWRSRFGSDEHVIGRELSLNGEHFTVVGVVAADNQYPMTLDVFVPRVLTADERSDKTRGARWMGLLARIKPGVSLEAAKADLQRVVDGINRRFPDEYDHRTAVPVPMREWIAGDITRPLWVVMGAVGLVLLIACANVANLLLVRATSRETELAVRTALGAGEGRLVRQLVTEAMLLTAIGAAVGVLIAAISMKSLVGMVATTLPVLARSSLDGMVLAATAVVALVTGVIFGVLPAHQVTRGSLAASLRAGARGTRTRPGTLRLRRAIVVGEMAMAVTLLAGAGLLLRSFSRLMHVDPGFDPAGVMTYNLGLPDQRYDNADKYRAFANALEAEAKATPGAVHAAIASELPLDGRSFVISYTIHGRPAPPPNQRPSARIISITDDYFATLGMKLLRGRQFDAGDRNGAAKVAVVNEAFVAKAFPREDPIGKYVELGWSEDGDRRGGTIVGVVNDVKQRGLDADAFPTMYLPYTQAPRSSLSVAVRLRNDKVPVGPSLRAQVARLDPDLPLYNLRPMEDIVATSVATEHLYMVLLASFAAIALLLSAVGLYGVIAYAVSERTQELGVRVALGASSGRISRMILGEGLTMSIAGIVVGLAASAAATQVLTKLLFGIKPSDPVTFVAVSVALVAVALAASFFPARRAAKADPLVAMRGD